MVTVFSVATRLLGFAFKIFVSRAYGAEVMGLYQISISVLSLLFAFTASGIAPILSRRVAELNTLGDPKRGNAMLSASLIISVGSAVFLTALVYILQDYIGVLFSDERSKPMFLIMLPILISTSAYSCIRSWFWGRKEYLTFSVTEFMEELFRVFFVVVLSAGVAGALSGANVIAIAVLAGDFFSLFILFFIFLKRKGRLSKPAGFKELAKRSVPLTAVKISGGLVGSFTALIIPARLIAAGLTAAEATAMYGRVAGMALPLIMVPTMITGALAVVLIPEIASASAAEKSGEIARRVKNSILFSVLVSSIFVVAYIPLGQQITRFLFNDTDAGKFVQIAAILIFPIGLNQISNTVLNSLGLEKNTFFHYVAGAGLMLPAMLVLPKYIGIYSIAVGTFLCFGVTSTLNILKIRRHLKMPIGEPKKTALTVLFAVPPTAIGWFLADMMTGYFSDFFIILATAFVSLGLYCTALNVFKIVDLSSIFVIGKSNIVSLFKKRGHKKKTAQTNKKPAKKLT